MNIEAVKIIQQDVENLVINTLQKMIRDELDKEPETLTCPMFLAQHNVKLRLIVNNPELAQFKRFDYLFNIAFVNETLRRSEHILTLSP